jgi:hypothetical protein
MTPRIDQVRCSKPAARSSSILVVPGLRHHLSGMTILAQITSIDVLYTADGYNRRRRCRRVA